MKKKIINTILIILGCLIAFNFYKVEAFSGELDPESYITLPSMINIQNGIGKGTVTLSPRASGYNISYQKVDISESEMNSIATKITALNNAIAEYNSASEANKSAALARVNTARSEYYALLPDYTSSWTSTTNTSNNIQLNFGSVSGTVHFVIWVKITNGTNTYYDAMAYSTSITPSGSTGGSGSNESDIKIELKSEMGIATLEPVIEISNLNENTGSRYYLVITSNSNKPNVTWTSDECMSLKYNNTKKIFTLGNILPMAKCV